MQNVRVNVKVLEFKSFWIFSCILNLLIILIKPLTTKAYDRRASGDYGTSGYIVKRFMSFTCVPTYGLLFRIPTCYHALHLACRVFIEFYCLFFLVRFPYLLEKWTRRISGYSYLLETLISIKFGLITSGHVTVLCQWLLEKNTDYIIKIIILISYRTLDWYR